MENQSGTRKETQSLVVAMCWFTGDKRGEELLQRLRMGEGRGKVCYISWGREAAADKKGREKWRFRATRALPRKWKRK